MTEVKKYYLRLATVVIRFDVPTNLYLFDDWQRLFDETLVAFRVEAKKQDFIVRIVGTTLNGFKVDQKNISSPVPQPHRRGRVLYFDNLLHSRYLLMKVADLIRTELAKRSLFMFHASGVAINSREAILFTGPSGSGKSTCLKKLSPPLIALGDDIVVIGLKNKKVICYPYPINLKVEYGKTKNITHSVLIVMRPKRGVLSLTKDSPTAGVISAILNQFLLIPSKDDTAKILKISSALSRIHHTLSHNLPDEIYPLLHTVGPSTILSRRTSSGK